MVRARASAAVSTSRGAPGSAHGWASRSKPNGPARLQVVDINRDLNGLIFNQNGQARMRSVAGLFGATFDVGGGLTISGGPAITWWSVDHTQTGSLRAFCPSPCQTVRTDDVTSEANGTDVGFFVGTEFYPGNRWIGFQVLFVRTRYQGVYDSTAALAWPDDWTDNNVYLGVTLRTNRARR